MRTTHRSWVYSERFGHKKWKEEKNESRKRERVLFQCIRNFIRESLGKLLHEILFISWHAWRQEYCQIVGGNPKDFWFSTIGDGDGDSSGRPKPAAVRQFPAHRALAKLSSLFRSKSLRHLPPGHYENEMTTFLCLLTGLPAYNILWENLAGIPYGNH